MREYHCTTCDFHITGPADEVADEIEAHEEQHHTDAAAKVEITPEILRAVSDWVFDTALPAYVAHALADAARQMEREQADEQRIDELAKTFAGAAFPEDDRTHEPNDALRRGVRAVLAKLKEERDAEVYGVRDNGDVLLTATDAANVKAVLRFVFGRNNGEPYPKDAIEAIRDYFWPDQPFDKGGHTVRPLRQWGDLRDVPDDVLAVHTSEGEAHRDRCSPNCWQWVNGADVTLYGLTAHAPYTEIPGGDR